MNSHPKKGIAMLKQYKDKEKSYVTVVSTLKHIQLYHQV